MKKLIHFVICGILAIVVVTGLTTSRAYAANNSCSTVICEPGRQYYPNPSECSSFCQCSNGTPYYQPCPEGLHFNPTLNVCDYPEDAGCTVEKTSFTPFNSTVVSSISTIDTWGHRAVFV